MKKVVVDENLVSKCGLYCGTCRACIDVCPTGAIPLLQLEEKRQAVIGLASINRDRCLPWAYNIPCIVCEEACPVADKAIQLEEVPAVSASGETMLIQRPHVLQELCVGCGMCEFQCPMGGEAAIRVYAPTDVSTDGTIM